MSAAPLPFTGVAVLTPEEDAIVHRLLSQFLAVSGGWRTTSYELSRVVAALDGRDLQECVAGEVAEVPFRSGKLVMQALGFTPAELDRMSTAAKRKKHPLERDLVVAFFPEWLWPSIINLIRSGPQSTIDEVEEIFECWAAGLTSDGVAELETRRSSATLNLYIAALWSFMRCVCDVKSKMQPDDQTQLEGWTRDQVPPAPKPEEFGAKSAHRDRRAPELLAARRMLKSIDAEVARKKRRQHWRKTLTLELRDRAILAILAVLGLRPESLWRMNVEDFVPEHVFPDGTTGPALACPPVKREKDVHIKALPPLVGEWVQEYIDFVGGKPGEPLWRPTRKSRSLERLSQQCFTDPLIRYLSPHCEGKLYSPGTMRHLAAKLATLVGIQWITDSPRDFLLGNHQGLPSAAETFGAVLLSQTLKNPTDRYRDVNSIKGREQLTKFIATGSWEWLWGDRGARKGPDVELIANAEQAVKRADTELRGVRAQLGELEQQVVVASQLDIKELLVLLVRQNALAKQLADATVSYERAVHRLEQARTVEVAIDDFAAEIPLALESDIELVDYANGQPLVRSEILPSEFCWAVGIPPSTLRRWMSGKLPHPYGDVRNLFDPPGPGEQTPRAVKNITRERRRCILLDELDPGRFHVDAWERLLEVCRRPMPRKPTRKWVRAQPGDRG